MLIGQKLGWPASEVNEEGAGPFRINSLLGVEIELENCVLPVSQDTGKLITPKLWATHTDNSLRNNGLEFVFKKPMYCGASVKALKGIEAFFKEYDMRPAKSDRTSVHVHVDARDITEKQLYKWLVLYTVYEPLLFNVFAKGRINSNFCVPVFESTLSRQTIGLLNTITIERFLDAIARQAERYRYSALNLDAFRKFGSMEFRHLKGEYRSKPLIDWIEALLCLKAWAVSDVSTLDSFFSGPSKLYHKDITRSIFSEFTAERFFQQEDYVKLFFSGLRAAQEITLGATLPAPPQALKERSQENKKRAKLEAIDKLKKDISATSLIPSELLADGPVNNGIRDVAIADLNAFTTITTTGTPVGWRDPPTRWDTLVTPTQGTVNHRIQRANNIRAEIEHLTTDELVDALHINEEEQRASIGERSRLESLIILNPFQAERLEFLRELINEQALRADIIINRLDYLEELDREELEREEREREEEEITAAERG